MFDILPGFIAQIIQFLAQKYGFVGLIIGYLTLVVAPVLSVAIEVFEAFVLVTASTKDDETAAKVRLFWNSKVLPVLEILPHVNIPIAPGIAKIMVLLLKAFKAIKAALVSWRS